MRIRVFNGLILVMLLLGVASCAKKEPSKIIFATDATFPPMESVDANKNIVGFDVDLINAVAAAGGFAVEFKNAEWDGIFTGLDKGKYDAVVSAVQITEERKRTMDFSIPYLNAGQVLTVRADLNGVSSLTDMRRKTLGAQIGTTGAFEIDKIKAANKIVEKTYDEIGLAFEDLFNARIDGVVADVPTAASYALQNDSYKGKLKIVGTPFTEEQYGVAVQKGNAKILNLINTGLTKVLNSGANRAIEKKWLY